MRIHHQHKAQYIANRFILFFFVKQYAVTARFFTFVAA